MPKQVVIIGGILAGAALLSLGRFPSIIGDQERGRPASEEVIHRMEITVAGDGTGLPAGTGSVAEGRAIFNQKCAACHGPAGRGGVADRLTGGIDTLTGPKPIKTIASYWPYAPTLFDYIRRAMPLTAPQSLKDREVYALVAYLLSIDGIVAADARLDARSLARIRMPNRDGFVSLENKAFDGNIERKQHPSSSSRVVPQAAAHP
ncbi:c-type cytochrome [Sphingomonas sp. TX0543]|uniref:c-type cytochrome n=1 Tax=unclassified Sphingomonas TaxID=196159 RepID=UPI0010F7E841|nr:cytochrome c [Sphingomonas sp. 3P27F8]